MIKQIDLPESIQKRIQGELTNSEKLAVFGAVAFLGGAVGVASALFNVVFSGHPLWAAFAFAATAQAATFLPILGEARKRARSQGIHDARVYGQLQVEKMRANGELPCLKCGEFHGADSEHSSPLKEQTH